VRARDASHGPWNERPVRWEANVVDTRQSRYPGRSSRQDRTIDRKGEGSSASRAGSSAASKQRRNTASRAGVAADAPAPAPALLAAPAGAPGAANGCCASAAARGVRGALCEAARVGLRPRYADTAPVWRRALSRAIAVPAGAAATGSHAWAGTRCRGAGAAKPCARESGGATRKSADRNSSVDVAARALKPETLDAGPARISDSNWAMSVPRLGISAPDARASLPSPGGGGVALVRSTWI
jgi:hypothetical protein